MPFPGPLEDTAPALLTRRQAFVELDKLATFRFTGDVKDEGVSKWLSSAAPAAGGVGAHTIHEGNEVTYLVDGPETYAAMADVIGKTGTSATGTTDFIYMLNWVNFSDMPFPSTTSTTSLRDALTAASKGPGGAQVCGLLWAQADATAGFVSRTANLATVAFINGLSNGSHAFFDNKTPLFGSHHQKVLIVQNSNGLVAFCGGVDFNPDRLFGEGQRGAAQKGGPMHDVHCRLRGPVVDDLLRTFTARWRDAVAFDRGSYVIAMAQARIPNPPAYVPPPPLRGEAPRPDSPKVPGGRLRVQMGRTFANGTKHNIDFGPFSFAPSGETTTLAMLLFAIAAAKRYIYVEDQYLVSMDVSRALAHALSANTNLVLIVLIPHSSISDLPDVWNLRKDFIAPLRAAGGERVRIYVRKGWNDGGGARAHSYVHAKTWMFDDRLAVIGSTNCNLRGYTYDAEIGVGVFDEATNARVTFTFAHRLRIKLWAEHTGLGESDLAYALLADPISGSAYWESTRSLATRYNEDESTNWTTGLENSASERDGR